MMLLAVERRAVELRDAASMVEFGKKYRMLIWPISSFSSAAKALADRMEVVVWETSPTTAVTLK